MAKRNHASNAPVTSGEVVMEADQAQAAAVKETVATEQLPAAEATSEAPMESELNESSAETSNEETGEVAALTAVDKTDGEKQKSKYPKAVSLSEEEYKALKEFYENVAGDRTPENVKWDDALTWPQLGKNAKQFLNNFMSRGLVEANINEENGGIDSAKLTQKGYDSLRRVDETGVMKQVAGRKKATGEKTPRASTARVHGVDPNAKIRLLVDKNPRREGTQGYAAFNLYQDGMSYRDYLDADYDAEMVMSNGVKFKGPLSAHFKWDLMNGYIGLYDSREEEFKDGSENPKYWINPSKWARENLSAVKGGAEK